MLAWKRWSVSGAQRPILSILGGRDAHDASFAGQMPWGSSKSWRQITRDEVSNDGYGHLNMVREST